MLESEFVKDRLDAMFEESLVEMHAKEGEIASIFNLNPVVDVSQLSTSQKLLEEIIN